MSQTMSQTTTNTQDESAADRVIRWTKNRRDRRAEGGADVSDLDALLESMARVFAGDFPIGPLAIHDALETAILAAQELEAAWGMAPSIDLRILANDAISLALRVQRAVLQIRRRRDQAA